MIATALVSVIYISLAIHTLLISYAIWRVWRGENENRPSTRN